MNNPRKENFLLIAIPVLFLTALAIGINWPQIARARNQAVDNLINRADQSLIAGDRQEYLLYLRQASLISPSDPRPRILHAQYYRQIGDLDTALAIYKDGPEPSYIYLGNLALANQNWPQAMAYFDRSIRDKRIAPGLAGKAIALFNLKQVKQGCDAAKEAYRLDINAPSAEKVAKVCAVLSNEVGEGANILKLDTQRLSTKRGRANFLIENGAVVIGENELESSSENTPGDWLLLAHLAMERSDYDKAWLRAEQGLKQVPADANLLQIAIDIKQKLADQSSGQKRQNYESEKNHFVKLKELIPR